MCVRFVVVVDGSVYIVVYSWFRIGIDGSMVVGSMVVGSSGCYKCRVYCKVLRCTFVVLV